MINRAAHFGRAPTVYDLHHILGILRITENSLGDLSEDFKLNALRKKIKAHTFHQYLIFTKHSIFLMP